MIDHVGVERSAATSIGGRCGAKGAEGGRCASLEAILRCRRAGGAMGWLGWWCEKSVRRRDRAFRCGMRRGGAIELVWMAVELLNSRASDGFLWRHLAKRNTHW